MKIAGYAVSAQHMPSGQVQLGLGFGFAERHDLASRCCNDTGSADVMVTYPGTLMVTSSAMAVLCPGTLMV